jgi:hypothetical protein
MYNVLNMQVCEDYWTNIDLIPSHSLSLHNRKFILCGEKGETWSGFRGCSLLIVRLAWSDESFIHNREIYKQSF